MRTTPDFRIEPRPFLDLDVARLVAEVQQEYVVRYGGPDDTPLDPGQFDPPAGVFLLGLLDGDPVTIGGWRTLEPGVAEIKRMYVAALRRRRGLARLMLAELERTAAQANIERIVLESGAEQPEALAMYAATGYRPVTRYGHYRDAPSARHLGKALGRVARPAEVVPARRE